MAQEMLPPMTLEMQPGPSSVTGVTGRLSLAVPDVVGDVANLLWGVCYDTYDRKLSRQCLSSRPPVINSRSIWRSSLRISRPLAAFAFRFSSFSLVNFP